MIQARLRNFWNSWQSFWWFEVDPRSLKATRLALGLPIVGLYFLRFWRLDLYDERALVARERALDLLEPSQRPWFSWNFWPDSAAFAVHAVYWVLLVLFTLGWTRRPLMTLAWVLHVGFLHRNFAPSLGVDTMVTVFLFYLSFCEVWKSKGPFDALTPVMVRMCQVHLSIIYFYTGLEKLRGGTWWEGSSLWTVFNNPQMTPYSLQWTYQIPSVLAVLAHLTVLFEIFFGVLVFNSRTRLWVLATGISFHLGIAVVLDLWWFSAVMLAPYFLFLRSEDWQALMGVGIVQRVSKRLETRLRRKSSVSI
ncbi:MAG: HTTM domain-containing protein [Bdellovibrionales bacterium]